MRSREGSATMQSPTAPGRMSSRLNRLLCLTIKFLAMKYLSILVFLAAPVLAQQYDVVLANGRVMDPESGLDAVRNVGIGGGRIAAISGSPLNGRTVVDVKGLVVAPGFIDLHVHKHSPEVYGFKARDGVTTALELEFGVWPVRPWYAQREDRSLINFGAA